MPRLSPFFWRRRASRLTSPFVAATRRIRAFSARVLKPNNAADESKEKLKGKAGGMHEGRPPPGDGYGGRTIRQIASSQHVVSNKKLLPQGKTSVQSLSTRTHAKLFLCHRFCSPSEIHSKQLLSSMPILKHWLFASPIIKN
jgi:hypothetical protein